MAATTRPTAGGHGIQAHWTFDTSQVEARLRVLMELVDSKAAGKALFAAANELLADARDVGPQAPKRSGDLWRSARTTKAEVSAGFAEIEAGFNIEYAHKWHEVPLTAGIHWTYDKGASQPGPKFLESKLMMNRNKYLEIMADQIGAGTGMK
jgi:hypothetical protein